MSNARMIINLAKGHPNPTLLPVNHVRAASATALSDPEILTAQSSLLYAPDDGYRPLKENVAAWLSRFYSDSPQIGADRICITGGASQNLACVLQVFSDPTYTRNVWMVSPTYFHASRIFEDHGFYKRLRAVPEDDQGLNVEYLERGLRASEKEAARQASPTSISPSKPPRPYSKIYRHLIYAVPTFSNPSSMTMSRLRREQLVRVARSYDALVITDDVYDQLLWSTNSDASHTGVDRALLPRVVDIDRDLDGGPGRTGADGFGNSVSNGSFSKIVGPGCRTGWAEGTPPFAWGLSQCGSSKSGGAPSQLVAAFMAHMLQSGTLQDHISQVLQPACSRRYKILVSAVQEHLIPLGVTLPQNPRHIMGGYFAWLKLPEPLRAPEIAVAAQQDEDLLIAPGSASAVWGDEDAVDLSRNIRLCFSWEDEGNLPEGIARLARVIAKRQITSNQE